MFEFFKALQTAPVYTTTLQGDPDNSYIDLGPLIAELGWLETDELDAQIQGDCVVIKNLTKYPELF